MLRIDLNCDMGESFGHYSLGTDKAMMNEITSANIACGFHAGDPAVMRKTVRLAISKGVAIGAHPGLPDLAGFGRRRMEVSPEEVFDMVTYQIGALNAFVKQEGGILRHVKAHGALYNMAATNKPLADAIADAVYGFDSSLVLFGLAGSEMIRSGIEKGLRTASEVFADRTYQEDGTLTPRSMPGALIKNPERAAEQVVQMVKDRTVTAVNGSKIGIEADTVCIHGDGEHALSFARVLRNVLGREHVNIQAF
ncbi:5-oxoprolinase subunit PxpA [Paenibacillus sp. HJL G12]|uniref:5-oxoprolinase subunit A n=1 Tax=Paenibacillus dendrobii TaxID=2691084 RepID=A0A7X3LGB0_9BACL|nr:5-oxoprolinase subunit PxpA [Paenibacillus dendrobii]MWV43010.1 5-oxoprolinase subunit PxpA [Paenibacillus dendrobii]